MPEDTSKDLVVFAEALVLVGVPTFVDSGAVRFCPASSEEMLTHF